MSYINKIKHINILFLLKTGIGSAIAIIVSGYLGLSFSPSAGIITLLTIQNTKKETIFIALKRILAFFLAVVVSFLVFKSFGYTAFAFGGFVFLFVALCILLGLKDGISMNAVLMTHFLVEKRMDWPLILNEIFLLIIGMGIGIILNLIMPRNKKKIRREQNDLEEVIRETIRTMAETLRNKELTQDGSDLKINGINFTLLEIELEKLLRKAYEDADNTLLTDTKYLVSYLEMRKQQLEVLKEITEHINHIPVYLPQINPIADFMDQIAQSFHERNNVKGLLEQLEILYEYFRNEDLPKSREEFEYRAMLFQILKDLEFFLHMKRKFILELDSKNLKSYWD